MLFPAALRWAVVACAVVPTAMSVASEKAGVFAGLSHSSDANTPNYADYLSMQSPAPKTAQQLGGVGDDGALTYSVPIEIPPALVAPSVSVSYSSSAVGAASDVANGWSLHTGMTVTRLSRAAQAGAYARAPTTFQVNGGGLGGFLVEDTSVSGYVYYAMSGGVAFATFDDQANEWTVHSNGITTTLKSIWDHLAVQDQPEETRAWEVSTVVDAHGNLVTYDYAPDGRIASISYGQNENDLDTFPAVAKVVFNWAAVDPALERVSYANGAEWRYDQHLASIDVLSRRVQTGTWSTSRSYVFDYGVVDDKPSLDGVRLVGSDGVSERPLVAFSYSEFTLEFDSVALGVPEKAAVSYSTQHTARTKDDAVYAGGAADLRMYSYGTNIVMSSVLDINGDGLLDFVVNRHGELDEGVGGEFPPVDAPAVLETRTLMSDGYLQDEVDAHEIASMDPEFGNVEGHPNDVLGGLRVSDTVPLGDPSGQALGNSTQADTATVTRRQLLDVNGDGLLDIVESGETSMYGTYNPFETAVVQDVDPMPGVLQSHYDDGGSYFPGMLSPYYLTDLDGEMYYWQVYLGRSDGEFEADPIVAPSPFPYSEVRVNQAFCDVNDFDSPLHGYHPFVLTMLDVTGDALPDLVYFPQNDWVVDGWQPNFSGKVLVYPALPKRSGPIVSIGGGSPPEELPGWSDDPFVLADNADPATHDLYVALTANWYRQRVSYEWYHDWYLPKATAPSADPFALTDFEERFASCVFDEVKQLAGWWDLNGDGLVDFVRVVGEDAWDVYYGNGRGFERNAVQWTGLPFPFLSRTHEGRAPISLHSATTNLPPPTGLNAPGRRNPEDVLPPPWDTTSVIESVQGLVDALEDCHNALTSGPLSPPESPQASWAPADPPGGVDWAQGWYNACVWVRDHADEICWANIVGDAAGLDLITFAGGHAFSIDFPPAEVRPFYDPVDDTYSWQDVGLMDVDGDGLVDVVESTVDSHGDPGTFYWWRNMGSGFSEEQCDGTCGGVDYLSGGLRYSFNYGMTFDPNEVSDDTWKRTGSQSFVLDARIVQDVNNDGMLDMILPRAGYGEEGEIRYGRYSKSGLLVGVDNQHGGTSAYSFASSSSLPPVGWPFSEQNSSSRFDVVTSVETWDAVTADGARSEYGYAGHSCRSGACPGFASTFRTDFELDHPAELVDGRLVHTNNLDGEPIWIERLETTTSFELHRDGALPSIRTVSSDGHLSNSLFIGLGDKAFQTRFIERTEYADVSDGALAPCDPAPGALPPVCRPTRRVVTTHFERLLMDEQPSQTFADTLPATTMIDYVWDEPGGIPGYASMGLLEAVVVCPSADASGTVCDPTADVTDRVITWDANRSAGYAYPTSEVTSGPVQGGDGAVLQSLEFQYASVGAFAKDLAGKTVEDCLGGMGCGTSIGWNFTRHPVRGQVAGVEGPIGSDFAISEFRYGGVVPGKTVNAMGHETLAFVDEHGRVKAERDAAGVGRQHVYDAFGRPIQEWVIGVGGALVLASETSYHDEPWATSGRPVMSRTVTFGADDGDANTPLDVAGETWTVTDGFGRGRQTWSRGPSVLLNANPNDPSPTWVVSGAVTDLFGVPRVVEHPYVAHVASPADVDPIATSPGSILSWTDADALGAPRAVVTDPDDDLTFHTECRVRTWYTGTLSVGSVDESGRSKELGYDPLGRLVRVSEGTADWSNSSEVCNPYAVYQVGSPVPVATYAYDGLGHLTRITATVDPGTSDYDSYFYTYDLAGRLRSVQRTSTLDPSAPSKYRSYDYVDGLPSAFYEGDASGPNMTMTWDYDDLGRVIEKRVRPSDKPTDPAVWDVYNWVWDTRWIGVKTREVAPSATTEFFYDADPSATVGNLGRLGSTSRTFSGVASPVTMSMSYDQAGNVLSTTFPSGAKVSTVYALGWPVEHKMEVAGLPDETFFLEYSEENGEALGWSTDDTGHALSLERQLGAVTHATWTLANTSTAMEESYTYGADRRLLAKSFGGTYAVGIAPWTMEYTYDDLSRTVGVAVNGVTRESFEYDLLGRLVSFSQHDSATYASPEADWWYAPSDAFGEQVSRGYTDPVLGPQEEVYAFEPGTSRLTSMTRTVDGLDRHFSYDGSGQLVSVLDLAGGVGKQLVEYDHGLDDELIHRRIETTSPVSVTHEYHFGAWQLDRRPQGDRFVESVLPVVRLVTDATTGLTEREWLFREADGHAVAVARDDGSLVSGEVLGAYGEVLEQYGQVFDQDRFHGMELDSDVALTRMGVRHVMNQDGRWLQPEPLLGLGVPPASLLAPRGLFGVYALGSPVQMSDRSGYRTFGNGGDKDEFERAKELRQEMPAPSQQVDTGAAGADVDGDGGSQDDATAKAVEMAYAAKGIGSIPVNLDELIQCGVVTAGVTVVVVYGGRAVRAAGRAGAGVLHAVTHPGETVAAAKALFRGLSGKPIGTGGCFVRGTEVMSLLGGVAIDEVRVGDLLVAYQVGDDEGCQGSQSIHDSCATRVSAPADGTVVVGEVGAWSKQAAQAVCVHSSPSWDPADVHDAIRVFDPRDGVWKVRPAGPLLAGTEVWFRGSMYRSDGAGMKCIGDASLSELEGLVSGPADSEALIGLHSFDWVLLLSEVGEVAQRMHERTIRHVRLGTTKQGDWVVIRGAVFEVAATDDGLKLHRTGEVLTRAASTFRRTAEAAVSLVLVDDNGVVDTLAGTPNHPFWVPAVQDYVALEDLEVGTVLRTYGGSEATVLGLTWKPGEVEVYDIEVEGLHNFFVRGPGSDAPGVLVHNSTAATASSRTLGRSLEAAGHVRPANSAAHHIVAGGAEAAAPARAVLDRFGIGINDAANGVFLPASTQVANPTGAAVHSTLHTRAYYDTVNEVLSQATTRDQALEALSTLGTALRGGGL